jgi:hypothetical protein
MPPRIPPSRDLFIVLKGLQQKERLALLHRMFLDDRSNAPKYQLPHQVPQTPTARTPRV